MIDDKIKKYKDHPKCKSYVFQVLSNQKMNAYRKEIADLCDTITLSNNEPIDKLMFYRFFRSLLTEFFKAQ